MSSWWLAAPRRGPWYLLPIGLMVTWQLVSSIPALAYYHDHGIAADHSVSGQMSLRLNALGSVTQNVAHIPAFFLVAWAWCWALSSKRGPKRAALRAFMITGLFGVANELSQLVVPYRQASMMDVMANLTGASLAVLVHRALSA